MTRALSSKRAVGEIIAGRYRLERPLNEGGMGSVWRAYHLGLRVPVALKFLVDEHIESEDARARFAHEASAAARIRSPHVVTTLDYGEDHGTPYLAMELLEGEDLQARLERETVLPAGEVERILAQACKGLGKAHAAGIVHRDIKPANIFLAVEDGELCVKLLDFGVAKAWALKPGDLSGMNTMAGRILGTPLYMSPGQATGDALTDHRSDLYSLAVVAYVALAGRPPFVNSNQVALLLDVCQKPPPPPSQFNAHLGAAFDAFFARALAKHPEGRFSSTKEFFEQFSAAVRAAPQLNRPEGSAARLLGRFSPIRLLSSSALSEVYLVHQGSGDVEVLKILKRHAGLPQPLIDQLRRSVEAANRLPSGRFVRTFEVGLAPEFGHAPFLRLEYAPGVDLGELSRDRAAPLPQALACLEQIASALTEAHQGGLTHGDLRPQSVFVPAPSQPGGLKISGLGLSSFAREASQHRETGLMRLGPLYMAPEVARGRSGGAPTDDIWSVGLLAFRLLTGRDYWTGGDAMHIIAQLIHEPIVPPSARGLALGPAFDAWFLRSCDRDPTRRFSSCQEQQDALRAALAGRG